MTWSGLNSGAVSSTSCRAAALSHSICAPLRSGPTVRISAARSASDSGGERIVSAHDGEVDLRFDRESSDASAVAHVADREPAAAQRLEPGVPVGREGTHLSVFGQSPGERVLAASASHHQHPFHRGDATNAPGVAPARSAALRQAVGAAACVAD